VSQRTENDRNDSRSKRNRARVRGGEIRENGPYGLVLGMLCCLKITKVWVVRDCWGSVATEVKVKKGN